jgi:hypothetical protein
MMVTHFPSCQLHQEVAMHKFRVWWNGFKTVALLISFTVNMVLLIVLLLVLMQIFQIKNGIVEPLVDGLHRNFVGLDEAVIMRTINVDDEIPVQFDLPLNQSTNVVLTGDVPIAASATFTLPGGGGMINGRVDIVLPKGLILPVQLDMTVPVDTTIPINLPVEVSIPLNETQLHAPFDNLRNLLEPYVRVLDNLPGSWDEVPDFTIDAIQGEGVNLVSPTTDSEDPWPGPEAYESEAGPESGTEPVTSDGKTLTPEPTPTPIQDMGIIPQATQSQ